MSWLNKTTRSLLLAAAVLAATPVAFADTAGARKAVADAKKSITEKSWSEADTNLKLAEVELEDAAAADKAAIAKDVDTLKKQIAAAQGNEAKAEITKQADAILADATKYLTTDANGVIRASEDLEDLFKRDSAKAALSADEMEKYRTQIGKYKKVAQARLVDQNAEGIRRELERLESDYTEKMNIIKTPENPGAKDRAIDTLSRDLEIAQKHIASLPADNEKVKVLQARFDKMNGPFVAIALAAEAKEKSEVLKRSWESYADEYTGWQSENAPPTFAQYSSESSEKMSSFNAPKTKALINRADQFLKNREDDTEYKRLAAAADVKSVVDSITKDRAAAHAKMLKFTSAMVAEAEKAKLDDRNKNAASRLKDDVRLALGEASAESEALQARVEKLLTGVSNAAAGEEQAKKDAWVALKAQADKAWPAMVAKYKPESGFDPNNYKAFKGKTIKITTDNLMGYRFKASDAFPFATTVNGIPIAGKFDPAVATAVKAVQDKIGRELGDNDDDGKWEIIAIVDGTTGRLMSRKSVSGDLQTTNGEKVGTYTGEYADPVDAPIITIIAAHCGPLAISK